MKTAMMIAGAGLLGLTAAANAQAPPAGAAAGVTTRAQVEAQAAENFRMLDADGDGSVTKTEVEAFQTKMRANAEQARTQVMTEADTDKSGSLDQKEWTAMNEERLTEMESQAGQPIPDDRRAAAKTQMDAAFARLDADGNGSISSEELGIAVGAGDNDPAARMMDMFVEADTNGDGSLTVEELKAPTLAMFDKVDANGDGQITPDEGAKAQQELRAQ